MKHTTTNEWQEDLGNTQIVLRTCRSKNVFELVICDRNDSHSKFYCNGDLSEIRKIGEKIISLTNEASNA